MWSGSEKCIELLSISEMTRAGVEVKFTERGSQNHLLWKDYWNCGLQEWNVSMAYEMLFQRKACDVDKSMTLMPHSGGRKIAIQGGEFNSCR